MEILDLICFGCAFLVTGIVFLVALTMFGTSVFACFYKKIEGKLIIKILISVVTGCTLPWILKLMLFLLAKMGV